MKAFFDLRAGSILLLGACLAACVPLPPEEGAGAAGSTGITRRRFGELDPGAKRLSGLHFEVHAYGSDRAQKISDAAEKFYGRTMNDTGLYSFLPRGLYPVVVYATRDEFLMKTGLPEWSGGVAVGNTIYTYDGPYLSGVLAHEMTHLIFHEYMGRSDPAHRWVNEGLAVYEEQEAMRERGFASAARPGSPVSFQEMILLAPMGEGERSVNAWYQQVGSVVRFMIERGGRLGFSQFIKGLHEGRTADQAVRTAFPGVWNSFEALETSWRDGR
ncbi:MAG: hypothetical protein ABII00_07000 [Elusimicrobiota bacterium]